MYSAPTGRKWSKMPNAPKVTSAMAPPQRRSGAEGARGGGGKSGGRGRGRSGGGGGRGGPTSEPTQGQESLQLQAPTDGTRGAKAKPLRKAGGGGGPRGSALINSAAGALLTGRPARTVSTITRKVLVRNIPHDWDEEQLMELVESHGATRQHMWRFVAGKVRSNNRAPQPGRLYLDFKKDTELARSIIDKLNAYTVPDSKDQTKLEVDFAPFQKVPREKQRKDVKVGTIDRDQDFMSFLEALLKPKEKLPSADIATDSKDVEGGPEKPVAALVQYLNDRKRDKKGKFGGKAADKSRGARTKATKEGKATKEKAKNSKGKGKPSDPNSTKEAAKPRKVRGKALKEKSDDTEAIEPGAVKIMAPKTPTVHLESKQSSSGNSSVPVSSEVSNRSKSGGGKNGGGKPKPSRRNGPGQSETGSETAAAVEGNSVSKDRAKAGGGRRDSKAGKGPKSGARGAQQKKVFVPKATTPAG